MLSICKNPVVIFCLLALASCSNPVRYDADYQASYDFSKLNTYAWYTGDEAASGKAILDLVHQRIVKSVDQQLATKGYRKTSEANADFLVNYGVIKEEKIDIRQYNTYNGYADGWRFYPWGMYPHAGYGYTDASVLTRVAQYTQGTLVIDIVNGKTKEIIWRGTAAGKLSQKDLTPEERSVIVSEVVARVLSQFPPDS